MQKPHPKPTPGEAHATGHPREYVLSEADRLAELGRAFDIIAQLAPTLKEAELRVLIALARLFAANPHHSGRASTGALAKAARLSPTSIKGAIRDLVARSMLAKRKGTATSPSGYALTFLRSKAIATNEVGHLVTYPHPDAGHFPPRGGSLPDPQPDLFTQPEGAFVTRGGSLSDPPPYKERTGAGASIDSIEPDSIIDRLLKAKPKTFDARELAEARRWVHGHQCKYGRDADAHAPDDTIMAQLLTVAPLSQLIRLIQDLIADRKEPGGQYSWYVTVALQRIHGIQPGVLKARRAELRIVRQQGPAPITGEQQRLIEPAEAAPDPQFAGELLQDIQRRRAAK